MITTPSARILLILQAFGLFLVGCQSEQAVTVTVTEKQPNILLIVVDDMGYTDIGAFGSEIATPNIDELAMGGVRFTNFHSSPQCAPTRSILLSGSDNHKAGMGTMFPARMIEGDYGERWGYERYLHARVATLPERLGDAGYHTYMAGKWHLGGAADQTPRARGFERSFALVIGSASHMEMWSHIPVSYIEDGELIDALPEGFYSTNTYTDKMIDHIASNLGDDKPFFGYLALTSPHWPLQVPEEYLDKNAGKYDEGYDELRQRRAARASELGVVPDVDADQFEPVGESWEDLSEEEQRYQARKMEIFAGMMQNMDDNIGRVVSFLEEQGELDNTLIFFMSDNGAESDREDRNPTFVSRIAAANYFDNSYENLGSASSWTFLGPGWAQAATAPYRRFKGFFSEGGTRVTSFAYFPKMIAARGMESQYLNVMDVMPTFLDLANAEYDAASIRGRDVLPMDGSSFLPVLEGSSELVHSPDIPIAFELHGQRALRLGDWKAVWEQYPVNIWWDDEPQTHWNSWRLFNITNDPTELHDLSKDEPEKLVQLTALWDQWARDNDVMTDVTAVWPEGPPAGGPGN